MVKKISLYKSLFIIMGILFAFNFKMYSFAYVGPSGSTQISTIGSGSSDSSSGSGSGGSGNSNSGGGNSTTGNNSEGGGSGNSNSGGGNSTTGNNSGGGGSGNSNSGGGNTTTGNNSGGGSGGGNGNSGYNPGSSYNPTPTATGDGNNDSSKKEEKKPEPAVPQVTAEELYYSELESYRKIQEELHASDATIVEGAEGSQAYINMLMAAGYKLPDVNSKEDEKRTIVFTTREELIEKKQSENSSVKGDPVKITQGTYIQEETDFVLGKRNLFSLERKYSSDSSVVSSFGYGWSTNLDQWVIFGIEPKLQQIIDDMRLYVTNVPAFVAEWEKESASAFGVSSIYNAGEEMDARVAACVNNYTAAYSLLDSLNSLYAKAKEQAEQEALQKLREEVSNFYNNTYYKSVRINSNKWYVQWIVDYFNAVKTQAAQYEETIRQYEAKLPMLNDRKNKNYFVLFQGMDKTYEETGFDTITIIDENSYPHLLYETYEGSGVWNNEQDKSIVECRYENGELYLQEADGKIKVFGTNGFLSQIIDLNGNYVKINRNRDGKISSVETSDEEKLLFTYENGFIKTVTNARDASQNVIYYYSESTLTGVKDTDGDTVSMSYDSSKRLASLNKCDGTSIKFSYSVDGIDGKILTTATTNEENYTECFEYDRSNHKTTYIDQDNNQTVYFYDNKHRTVKEIHSDGTIIEYEYGPNDEYLRTTENGLSTTTYFDTRGNKIRIEYEDLSSETFSYDNNNFLISAIDRDGVKSEYIRDERSNLIEYRLGGKTVFNQSYDNKGNVTRKTEFSSQPFITEYTYDCYGNLISCRQNNTLYQYEYDSQNRIKKYSINGKEISTFLYSGKKVIQTDFNGLEQTSEVNDRKDLVNIIKKDLKTGQTLKTKIEYDGRHLPQNYYECYGEEFVQRFRCLYSGSGNITAYILYADGDESNYVWLYVYKRERVSEIHRFIIKGSLSASVTYEELLQYEQYAGKEVHIEKFDYSSENKNARILKIRDETGINTIYEYDSYGNLVYSEDGNGLRLENSYSRTGRITGMQLKNGGWYYMAYDSAGNLNYAGEKNGHGESAVSYPNGLIASKTDQYGNTSFYKYNQNGEISEIKTENQIKKYEYDVYGRMISECISSINNQLVYRRNIKYEENGRGYEVTEGDFYKVKYDLDAFGNVVKQTDGNGNETDYIYGNQGKITLSIDSYGQKTKYKWNSLGKICEVIKPSGNWIRYEYNWQGLLIDVIDEEGHLYQAEYNNRGQCVKKKLRADAEKSYDYDNGGNLTAVMLGEQIVETYGYDNPNGTITVKDGNGNEYVYMDDAFGRLEKEINRACDVMEYFYDEAGQLNKKVHFDGTFEDIIYSPDRLTCTIQYSDGTKNKYIYDVLGNVVYTENENSKISYEYDKAGQLIKQKDERTGEILEFSYDAAKNRIRMKGSNRDTVYRYGKNCELLEVSDNKQRFGIKFRYDENGNEIKRIFNNGIVYETLYDCVGRIIFVIQKSSAGEIIWAEGYVYDENGKRLATINEKGSVELYEYDKRGYISKVYYPYSQELIEKLRVEAEENGLPAVKDCGENKFLPAGIKTSIDVLMNKIGYGWSSKISNMQIFISESYKYDGNGNRIQKINPFGVVYYTYDSENRLISSGANGKTSIQYTYNKKGNLVSRESELYNEKYEYTADSRLAYSEVINKLKKEYSVINYSYDVFGRRILEQEFENPAVGFIYDGFSLDVVKQGPVYRNGTFTDMYETGIKYLKNGRPTSDRYRYLEDDNTDDKRYFYLDEENYKNVTNRYRETRNQLYVNGSITAQSLDSETEYFAKDILGSVRTVSDENGRQKISYSYDIFGSSISDNFTEANNYGYLGKQYDSITKLYNYGFREMSPSAARFTTPDPIRDGTNWFVYVNNDPVNFVDFDGFAYYGINGQVSIHIPTGTEVVILRNHDGLGNEFDSDRLIYKVYGTTRKLVYVDKVGANCAEKNEGGDNFTLPDGKYHLSYYNLIKQEDGTYNSGSYNNVLSIQTKDENIPENTRHIINEKWFLFHTNQFNYSNSPYNSNLEPGSAGCIIGKDGQAHHDEMMKYLMEYVDNPEKINVYIRSMSNLGRKE